MGGQTAAQWLQNKIAFLGVVAIVVFLLNTVALQHPHAHKAKAKAKAGHASADQPPRTDAAWCHWAVSHMAVVPRRTWGHLSQHDQRKWRSLQCDFHTGGGTSRNVRGQAPVAHHSRAVRQVPKHERLRARAEPSSGTNDQEWCRWAVDEMRVRPGSSYGLLTKRQQNRWAERQCDDVVRFGRRLSCDERFGDEFLRSWRASSNSNTVCRSEDGAQQAGEGEVECRTSNRNGVACVVRNAVVDFGKLTISGQRRYVGDGFVQVACSGSREMPPRVSTTTVADVQTRCQEWHPMAFIMSHDDTHNLYHHMADVMDVWETVQALEVNTRDGVLINADGVIAKANRRIRGGKLLFPNEPDRFGPFFPLYNSIFGGGVKRAFTYGQATVCFRELVMLPPVTSSMIWTDFWRTNECSQQPGASGMFRQMVSTLVRHYDASTPSGHGKALFEDLVLGSRLPRASCRGRSTASHDFSQYAPIPFVGNCLNVLFVVRRKAPEWKTATLQRQIENVNDVVHALQDATRSPRQLSGAGHVAVRLVPVDFATMSFDDQMALVRASDVIIGMHGAGLVHALWLPTEQRACGLIELFPPGGGPSGGGPMGVANVARHAGVHYESVVGENTEGGKTVIAATDVLDALDRLMKVMAQPVK